MTAGFNSWHRCQLRGGLRAACRVLVDTILAMALGLRILVAIFAFFSIHPCANANLALLQAASPPDQSQVEVDRLLEDAQRAFQRQEYSAAILDYERVVELRPDSAEA